MPVPPRRPCGPNAVASTMARVLLAAVVTSFGRHPFTLPDLAIAAWEHHPDVFGLAGYTHQYPDNARVRACLWGKHGLLDRHIMQRVHGEPGLYQRGPNAPLGKSASAG